MPTAEVTHIVVAVVRPRRGPSERRSPRRTRCPKQSARPFAKDRERLGHPRAMRRSPLSRDQSGHTRGATCNLYSLTKGQAAIRDWFRAQHDRTGNLPLFPGIFPDQFAPILRTRADGERELVMARWGMPGPPRSQISAMSAARTGARIAAASSPRHHFANTPTRSRARRRHGSRCARISLCSPLRAYGHPGAACAAGRARRSRARMSCSAF
jgi:hypothetical protein